MIPELRQSIFLVGTRVYHSNRKQFGVTKWYDPKEPDRIEVLFDGCDEPEICSPGLLCVASGKNSP